MVVLESGASGDPLEFRSEYAHGAVLFHFSGRVDRSNVSVLWSSLKAACEDGHSIIVDLGGLEDINAMGLEALLDCYKIFIERGQRLVLAGLSDRLANLLGAQASGQTIPAFTSIEAAAESFRFCEQRGEHGEVTGKVE